MAISQTYCDFATGNDYKGATFTDGSFDNATLTLTKTGAFAASRVNHWLYLDDNGSGEVASGYYRITTVTSDDAVVLDADIRSGANNPTDVVCTQHDGTITLPWRSVQGALDLITRDSTNGNQVNIKAGTTIVLEASLTLATYGTPTSSAPLVLRGFTATANDGGMGAIDASALELFAATNYPSLHLVDLVFSGLPGVSGTYGARLGVNCLVYHCSFASARNPLTANSGSVVANCYFAGVGGAGIGCAVTRGAIINCYVRVSADGLGFRLVDGGVAYSNILLLSNASTVQGIQLWSGAGIAVGNIIYNTLPGTKPLLNIVSGDSAIAVNNILCGASGSGGTGIFVGQGARAVGHNAFYNNTTAEIYSVDPLVDLGGDVALAADPFTDAANGDFSLTAAAKAALAGKGFPTEYLGAHANTVPNITIGAIQQVLATSGGGFPKIASVLGRTRM